MKNLLHFLFVLIMFSACRNLVYVKGFFVADLENSQFESCQSLGEWWWITGDSNLFIRYDSLAKENGYKTDVGSTVFVEVSGNLSEKGSYGHLSNYSREFEIEKSFQMDFDSSFQNLDHEFEVKKEICTEK